MASAPFVPELERLVSAAMDEWQVPGLALAVVQNGEPALVGAYGLRDAEGGFVAGMVAERVSGRSWTEFTRARLTDKLHMTVTFTVADLAAAAIYLRDCIAAEPHFPTVDVF